MPAGVQSLSSPNGMGLPASIEGLCHYNEGMVILAGVTGSGKSTTIAAMIDYINYREPLHILTVEDPIEFTFVDRMAYINQREIGLDTRDWHKALKDAGLKTKMIMQIHDELLFESPKAEVEKASEIIEREMEAAAELDVPLIAEIGFGDDWMSAK